MSHNMGDIHQFPTLTTNSCFLWVLYSHSSPNQPPFSSSLYNHGYFSKIFWLISMATSNYQSAHTPFHAHLFREVSKTRKRNAVMKVSIMRAQLSESNAKKAHLSARRKGRIKLPSYGDGENRSIYHISEFLSHPSGVEAILNTRALQSCQPLDSNLYRCSLPQVQLLNFEVAPIMDLQVTPSSQDCVVEMLSCKFEGSGLVERQNEHFSASLRNHIKWETIDAESFLDVDVSLNLVLEIYTQPFALLPASAVEGPGNIMMQALLDQLVPLLLQQLLQDYEEWVRQQQQTRSYLAT